MTQGWAHMNGNVETVERVLGDAVKECARAAMMRSIEAAPKGKAVTCFRHGLHGRPVLRVEARQTCWLSVGHGMFSPTYANL